MWSVELEPEVRDWLLSLDEVAFGTVMPHVERLANKGNLLRMPASRALGDGLFELRFDLERSAWRITYFFATEQRIVFLTVFRKQRQNERSEVQRARWARTRCINKRHTAEEDE
jgi:phage-related protein